MTLSRFDAATTVRVLDASRAAVHLDGAWNVDGRILNGGYVQAVAVRAAAAVLGASAGIGRPVDPVAVSTAFAAPAQPGPAEVAVDLLRSGRRVSTVTATLRQAGSTVLACLVTFGVRPPAGAEDPAGARSPHGATAMPSGPAPIMPVVPGPADCLRVGAGDLPGPPGIAELVDLAFVPDRSRWLAGEPGGEPAIRCWMAFADGREIDGLAVLALVDMAPPVSFAQGRFGWAPTLQLQVGILGRPRGTHVLLDLRGEPYDGAYVVEDGLVWDSDGALLARSRQIAVPPRS